MIEGELPAQPTQPSLPNQRATEVEESKSKATVTSKGGKKDGPIETPDELVDTFEYISKLGEGTYGVVHMAK